MGHPAGPELRTWCLAYPAYLALVLDPFTSIFRYALPLFPLLAVIARRRVGPAAPPLVVGPGRPCSSWPGVVGAGVWIWTLLVFVPPSDYPP